jgi:hypothetical protein
MVGIFGKEEGMTITTVGVRGGVERGGGLGLTLAEDAVIPRVLTLTQQGKPKAPAPLHASPYPYFCAEHSSYLNGIGARSIWPLLFP